MDDEPAGRRPQTWGGAVYLLVVGMAMVGMAVSIAGAWRNGVRLMGVAVVAGALSRLLLSDRQAGMLGVRRKWSDVGLMLLAGTGLIVLTFIVLPQRG